MCSEIKELERKLLETKIFYLEKEIEIETKLENQHKVLNYSFITDKYKESSGDALEKCVLYHFPLNWISISESTEWQLWPPMVIPTFKTLKNTLNKWNPDKLFSKEYCTKVEIYDIDSLEFIKKCVSRNEPIQHIKLIQAFCDYNDLNEHERERAEERYKLVLFNVEKHEFLFRTIMTREFSKLFGFPNILYNPSHHDDWFISTGTVRAPVEFWNSLKETINSIK